MKPTPLCGSGVCKYLDVYQNIVKDRIFYLESVDVVDKRRLGRDLEISDDGVSLATEIDEVGVGVVDGKHDAVAGVQLHHHDRVVQVT